MAIYAYAQLYRTLADEGTQKSMLNEMHTRQGLYDTICYWEYEALDAHLARSI
ncbi:MAG: hypothetical protein OWU33_06730 [Firmicutes bacterium]|nr:hypothetical protein [Bacillota bacterium]